MNEPVTGRAVEALARWFHAIEPHCLGHEDPFGGEPDCVLVARQFLGHEWGDLRAALVAALLDGHEAVLAGALEGVADHPVGVFDYASHAAAIVAALAAAGKEPNP